MLTFDEQGHQYFYDGKPVVNVTRVLSVLTDYSHIDPEKLRIAQEKGTAVHKTVELWCKGDLDEETLPEWLKPVLAKWIEFVGQTGFKVIESEKMLWHPVFHYAGMCDLFGYMAHYKKHALIDLKRSFFAGQAIGLQLSAYLLAYAEENKEARGAERYALRLNETGPVRLQHFTDGNQPSEFLTLLTAQRIKEKYK